MNLHQLRVFYEVASARSFTSAAAKLNLTQPATTWQVKRLEEACGLKFLDRAGKRVALTEEGKVLFDFAVRIHRLVQETEEALADLRGLPLGTLRIDATYIVGDYYLPGLLEALHRRHPGISFQIGIGNSSQVIENTLAQKNDIGVCAHDPTHPKLEARRILTDLLVAVVGPTHPFARRRTIALRELAGQPLILREQGSSPRRTIDEILKRHGINPTVIMESASTPIIKRFAANGVGRRHPVAAGGGQGDPGRLAPLAALPRRRDRVSLLPDPSQGPLGVARPERLRGDGPLVPTAAGRRPAPTTAEASRPGVAIRATISGRAGACPSRRPPAWGRRFAS